MSVRSGGRWARSVERRLSERSEHRGTVALAASSRSSRQEIVTRTSAAPATTRTSQATLSIGEVLDSASPGLPRHHDQQDPFSRDRRPGAAPIGPRPDTASSAAEDVARLRYVLAQQTRPLPAAAGHQGPAGRDRPRPGAAGRGRAAAGAASARSPTTRRPRSTSARRVPHDAAVPRRAAQRHRTRRRAATRARAIRPDRAEAGGHYDDDALAVGQVVAELGRYGLEGRHLRAFRTAAEREVGLFGQVVGPMAKQRGAEARRGRKRPSANSRRYRCGLHAALVQIGLRDVVGGRLMRSTALAIVASMRARESVASKPTVR